MTNPQLSEGFDILYNNITSNQSPGLDEIEKSFFLNKAQDELLKSYFNPRLNKTQQGFDNNERRQIDFSNLINISKITTVTDNIKIESENGIIKNKTDIFEVLSDNSINVSLPNDIFLILNETLKVARNGDDKVLNVIPIDYKEYNLKMSKPYKRPLKNQAWRINLNLVNIKENNTTSASKIVQLIAGVGDIFEEYIIRYIKKPNQIDLTNDSKTCELDEILHQELLQRAVELAKAAYIGDLGTMISTGMNSATEKGYIPQSNG